MRGYPSPIACVICTLALVSVAALGQDGEQDLRHIQAARAEALTFPQPHATFGDSYQRTVIEHRYAWENRSDKSFRVLETVAVSGGGELTVEPEVIGPHASGYVTVRQPLGDRLGSTSFRYAIVTDESGGARYRMTLSGFVQSAYDPVSPTLDFGVVDRTSGGSVEFELYSREIDRLELRGVEEKPAFVEVIGADRIGVAGEGVLVLASLSPDAPEGHVNGQFVLQTNVPHQPALAVPWRAIVAGSVMATENPFDLGLIEIGSTATKELRLISRDGSPFEVERFEAADPLMFTDGPCADAEGPTEGLCRSVTVSWEPTGGQRLSGVLQVFLRDQADPIRVKYRGLAVPPGTRVKELTPPPSGQDGGR